MPGVEVRIADSGEVLVRSPGLMKEYYKRPDATREAIDPEGFFHTGDAGYFDAGGHLKSSTARETSGSSPTAPCSRQSISRTSSSSSPTSKRQCASVRGATRSARSSTSTWPRSATGPSGATCRIPATRTSPRSPPCSISSANASRRSNRDLALDSTLANSQIRRFLVLHKELEADDGELTRTRKVRRRHIGDKYALLIDALYSHKTSCFVETQMRFEDGRTGTVSADLQIVEAKTFSAAAARKAA